MIKISERLKTLGQYINPDETMADIGTDHGFLPVYLAQNKLCRGAVLTDVSKASLEKGRKNVIANFPELLLNSTSLSTGFDDNIENYMKYEVPERDTLVNTALGREFLKRKLRQEQNILAKLRSANISNFELQVEGRIDPNSKKKLIEQRIDYLKKLIEFGN